MQEKHLTNAESTCTRPVAHTGRKGNGIVPSFSKQRGSISCWHCLEWCKKAAHSPREKKPEEVHFHFCCSTTSGSPGPAGQLETVMGRQTASRSKLHFFFNRQPGYIHRKP